MFWSPRAQQDAETDAHRRADYGNNPGRPNWGPTLDSKKAKEHEHKLTLTDPFGIRAWDLAADARQLAWDESIFAASLNTLFKTKNNVSFDGSPTIG